MTSTLMMIILTMTIRMSSKMTTIKVTPGNSLIIKITKHKIVSKRILIKMINKIIKIIVSKRNVNKMMTWIKTKMIISKIDLRDL